MEPQSPAKNDFTARRGSKGLLRVWQWTDDPRVSIRERINASGGLGYRVTLPKGVTGGRVIFVQSRDFEDAKAVARAKGLEFRESRSTALVLSDEKKIQAARAVKILSEKGLAVGLDEAANHYADAANALLPFNVSVSEGAKQLAEIMAIVAPTGKPLRQVVELAVARLCPQGGTKSLSELAKEMVEMKRGWLARGDLRDASFRDFMSRANKIADEIGSLALPEVTKEMLFEWLQGLSLTRRSKKNYRMVLAEMLRYAAQKRFISANPLEEFTRQDIKEIEGNSSEMRQPSILSPSEASKLLDAAFSNPDLDLGAAVVLGLFGGIRTEEIKRLQWDAVRLDDESPFVVIGPEIAKKRRIRNVPLPACAIAWLQRWKHAKTGPVARSAHTNDFQKRFKKLCAAAKIKWESNAMRHSFGSYHFALYANSLETARILGHKGDDNVLFAHYRALTSKEQGATYFGILPPSEGKVIAFPAKSVG